MRRTQPCGTVAGGHYGGDCRAAYSAELDGPRVDVALPPRCVRSHHDPQTVVLTALLSAAPNAHGGAMVGVRNVHKAIDNLLARSPGLFATQLHVAHDDQLLTAAEHRSVTLHRFAPQPSRLGNDQRWPHFESVLRTSSLASTWQCAYAIDISDASVLCLPPCHPTDKRLYFSSDSCSILPKQWLYAHAARMRINLGRWRHNVSQLLTNSRPVANVGVVGGHRSVMQPALRQVVHAYEQRWASGLPASALLVSGADMLLWNGVSLEIAGSDMGREGHSSSARVELGYPYGSTTLPWMGKLATGGPGQELCRNVMHTSRDAPYEACNATCRGLWATEVAIGRYHFAHKLPAWWLRYEAMRGRMTSSAAAAGAAL